MVKKGVHQNNELNFGRKKLSENEESQVVKAF